jgi:hypothetical protein
MKTEGTQKHESEGGDKPYQSLDDWKKDIAHLKWLAIILLVFALVLIGLFQLKLI